MASNGSRSPGKPSRFRPIAQAPTPSLPENLFHYPALVLHPKDNGVWGVGALGTWRSLSLPDMLPDYVVYDEGVEAAHGQLLLGLGSFKAGGYFDEDWGLRP